MKCPEIADLPAPPAGRAGWPWTEGVAPPADANVGGRHWPKISIVTPSFNQARFLEETIRSVLLQGYPHIEYVVIDGGSRDESKAIIERYAPWLSFWVSERDRGQTDAINKGLARCSGQIFNWINSDDVLAPGALFAIARAWSTSPHRLIAGKVDVVEEDGSLRENLACQNLDRESMLTPWERGVVWGQQAVWVPMDLIGKAGALDVSYNCCFDWEWILRLLEHGSTAYIPETLASFRIHGESKTSTLAETFAREMDAIAEHHLARSGNERQRRSFERYLRDKRWMAQLDEIRDQRRGLPSALEILARAALRPERLTRRFTWGAVRRALVRH